MIYRFPILFLIVPALFFSLACSREKPAGKELHPLELSSVEECALDGMIIANYPGPKAQIQYKGDEATEFFCETKELFQVYLQPGMKARVAAMYVQNTSQIEWSKPEDHWIEAAKAFYVVGSSISGSMGPTYAPFESRDAAAPFVKEYGGEIKSFEGLIEELGG